MSKRTVPKYRRKIAHLSLFGTTQLHYRNPWIVMWWSAAFPGAGHLLLQKYARGFLLYIWEMVVNTQAKINLSMVYTFNGQFEKARDVLDMHWMALYAPVFIFAMYDSYRTTVDLNKIARLAYYENHPIRNFNIGTLEINYLDKRKPWLAFVWSALMPGMGQLYSHRIVNGFFVLVSWIVIVTKSHFLFVLHFSILGDWNQARSVGNWEWLLFLPSIYLFNIYDAYVSTIECNKLFERELKEFVASRYSHPDVVPAPGAG